MHRCLFCLRQLPDSNLSTYFWEDVYIIDIIVTAHLTVRASDSVVQTAPWTTFPFTPISTVWTIQRLCMRKHSTSWKQNITPGVINAAYTCFNVSDDGKSAITEIPLSGCITFYPAQCLKTVPWWNCVWIFRFIRLWECRTFIITQWNMGYHFPAVTMPLLINTYVSRSQTDAIPIGTTLFMPVTSPFNTKQASADARNTIFQFANYS